MSMEDGDGLQLQVFEHCALAAVPGTQNAADP